MKKLRQTFILVLVAAMFLSCSSKPKIILPPDWAYEKDAINLNFTGDPDLNLYQKRAHSLVVCVYHLKDLNGFNQLTDEKDGLPRLLECGRFDPGVTYSRRLVVQPARALNETLDRTDGAKYVGVVAGYYNLQKENSVRTFPIPITGERVKKTLVQKPAKLNLDLYFGPQEIIEVKQTNDEEKEKNERCETDVLAPGHIPAAATFSTARPLLSGPLHTLPAIYGDGLLGSRGHGNP